MEANVAWICFGATLLCWIVASTILSYHWRAYGHGDRTVRRVAITYYVISTALFLAAAALILGL